VSVSESVCTVCNSPFAEAKAAAEKAAAEKVAAEAKVGILTIFNNCSRAGTIVGCICNANALLLACV
jgi:hypothetical protein